MRIERNGPVAVLRMEHGKANAIGAAFLERMEASIEAHAPGFRDLVLARRAWSPAHLEAADASLAGGDISAGSFAVDQQLLFRPGPSWWRWGTPVKGLYLASASVPPGAGVHGACGDLAARQALAVEHAVARKHPGRRIFVWGSR